MYRATLAIAIANLLAACGAPAGTLTSTPTDHTLAGTITLTDANAFALDLPRDVDAATKVFNGPSPTPTPRPVCAGSGGYGDLKAGAQVVVRDNADKIIATGALEQGLPVDASTCEFHFNVAKVPGSDFYSIEVSHRGALTYSADQLEQQDWRLQLTIGD